MNTNPSFSIKSNHCNKPPSMKNASLISYNINASYART
uniref:Uncharacterized protein n=1 Tax=Rhizophora mucronata TaxID=61149 RepID=A0A2P2Q121_RHIMU